MYCIFPKAFINHHIVNLLVIVTNVHIFLYIFYALKVSASKCQMFTDCKISYPLLILTVLVSYFSQ